MKNSFIKESNTDYVLYTYIYVYICSYICIYTRPAARILGLPGHCPSRRRPSSPCLLVSRWTLGAVQKNVTLFLTIFDKTIFLKENANNYALHSCVILILQWIF